MHLCNIVSSSRLYQFIALYYSIEQNIKHFEVYVLCMDDDTSRILGAIGFGHMHLIPLSRLEDDVLLNAKSSRTISEYCWTLKPAFILHILKQYAFINRLTYLDADMFLYNDPSYVFEKEKSASVLLSRHNFSKELMYMEKDAGIFNSGFISFKNSREGIGCLTWWKERCIDWCYDTTVTGQFGDQKYLELMYESFKGISIIEDPGINVAPWNEAKRKFTRSRGKLYIDDSPLILYHYCGFRICSKSSCIFMFGNTYKPLIHNPYMQAVKKAILQVQGIDSCFDGCFSEKSTIEKFNRYSIV
ncbi:MAG TPA: putative nucleotide-diphospho-sugar transferase [Clostridia bacterium]|nr:putative nucleotide-diphospho-sugar transferase [Clostridia bacterium]